MTADYIIVGAGLTGATIGRMLSDAGREVLIVEQRSHAGGNVHDHLHASGIRMHSYGPHYFRTHSAEVWEFVTRFAEFRNYRPIVMSLIDGKLENWPVHASYVRRVAGEEWRPAFAGIPRNFEEACLSRLPADVYAKFIATYTEKQWGIAPSSLSAELADRFEVRAGDLRVLTAHKHQGLPKDGYAAFFDRLLAGIPVVLNFRYEHRGIKARRHLIYTGSIDELFGCALGKLRYRCQHREHSFFADTRYLQPCVQVNNPGWAGGKHIRSIEWKHLLSADDAERINGTVITLETPGDAPSPEEYEYPFPDALNAALYRRYRGMANMDARMTVCGRLGDYKYYDMDHAIVRAMATARALLAEEDQALFVAQRHQRVHLRGAARRQVAGQQRHHSQNRRDGGERQRVGSLHAEQ
jgi:UDP-galactopyranose mutase